MADYKKVSDFKLDILYPDAEVVEKDDILGKEIVIEGFEELTGKFGEFSIVCFHYPDDESKKYTLVGGSVITRKLRKIKDEFPVIGSIIKPEGKRYYDLV